MKWIELAPSYEFPYYRYYTSEARLIKGRHYYCYFSLDEGRYRGWIMSVPGHVPESFIDVETREEAEEQYKLFLTSVGG